MVSESFESGQRLEKDSEYRFQVQGRQQMQNQSETPAGRKRVYFEPFLGVETGSVTVVQLIGSNSRSFFEVDSSSWFETTLELDLQSLYFS